MLSMFDDLASDLMAKDAWNWIWLILVYDMQIRVTNPTC